MRKEILNKQKEMIKLETTQIRSLKERNRILSRNHSLGWKEIYELIKLRQQNAQRHFWYYRLKNLYSKKHNTFIVSDFNKDYPNKTAVFYNEKGIEEFIIGRMS